MSADEPGAPAPGIRILHWDEAVPRTYPPELGARARRRAKRRALVDNFGQRAVTFQGWDCGSYVTSVTTFASAGSGTNVYWHAAVWDDSAERAELMVTLCRVLRRMNEDEVMI